MQDRLATAATDASAAAPATIATEAGERRALESLGGRLMGRLVLPLALLTLINAIDRVNISFAATAMMRELRFGPQTFGFGVSAFFVAYLLFQYPHAALLRRIGVKAWLASALLLWGLVGVGMALIQNAWQFQALRFLLGAAEAGFAPGVTYFIAQWVPFRFRASAMGVVLSAVPLALVLGGPVCGWMLGLGNPLHVSPWRFMFLLQAAPNLILALFAGWYFVDRPEQARWLTDEDRRRLTADSGAPEPATRGPLMPMLRDPRVLICAACWLLVMTGSYALLFWVPQLVRQLIPNGRELTVGLISALPQAGLIVGMLVNAWHSDRTHERVLHFAVAALFGGVALLAASVVSAPAAILTLLVLTGAGIGGAQGIFWTLPAALGVGNGRVPVSTIALLSMAGTAGGVIGPTLLGTVRESTGSFAAGIAMLAGLIILAAPTALLLRRRGWLDHLR
jgi:ACS family tartrate transporter-like MFS transporter